MILDEIMAARKEQLAREQKRVSFAEMQQRAAQALERRTPVSLAKALRKSTLSCICEVKKASPSKGLICPDFHPVEIAKAYEAAGANAISCLTEEHYFQGSSHRLHNYGCDRTGRKCRFRSCERISSSTPIKFMRQRQSVQMHCF